jgi:hypothetical protein
MKVEVDDARLAVEGRLEPSRRDDFVQSLMQARQSRGVSA